MCVQYESNVTIVEGSLQKIQSLQHRAVALVQLSESLDHLKGRIRLEEGKIPSSARGATRDQTIVTRDLKKKQSRRCTRIPICLSMYIHMYKLGWLTRPLDTRGLSE